MYKAIGPLLMGSALLLAACGGESGEPAAEAAPIGEVIQTAQGAVRGETVTDNDRTAYIYRGVPYAAPPVGDLRWMPPQPVEAWEGERDATEWPNRCPQGSSSMGTGSEISEDCLYVNVSTTAESSDEARPVMVFYHGGGLTSGTGNSTTYNHPMLPNKGVVLVTVNSRLGPIGYMAHPEITEGSGNFGTLDIRASLAWVRDNIAAFGGDPNNVTIFGESGGGVKVISQMASPGSHDLFHRAMVQSGSFLGSVDLEDDEARGVALGEALGAEAGEGQLAAMREATWEEVLEAASESDYRAAVAHGGDVVPRPIPEMFENGEQSLVPLVVGANAGEGSLRSSVPTMANLHSAAGAPTYTYNFTHLPLGWRQEEGCVAFHGLELTYVFGAVPVGLTSPTTQFLAAGGGCSTSLPEHDDIDLRVAEEAATIWASFAEDGDPSVEGLVDWPQWGEDSNVYLDIGDPMEAKTGIEESYTPPPSDDGE